MTPIDHAAVQEFVSATLLAVWPQLLELAAVLPVALFSSECPDRLFDAYRVEVMDKILDLVLPDTPEPFAV